MIFKAEIGAKIAKKYAKIKKKSNIGAKILHKKQGCPYVCNNFQCSGQGPTIDRVKQISGRSNQNSSHLFVLNECPGSYELLKVMYEN